jgi:hypothetical protein
MPAAPIATNIAALPPAGENCSLEDDPEKWTPVFPRDKHERVCAEIMLKLKKAILSDINDGRMTFSPARPPTKTRPMTS